MIVGNYQAYAIASGTAFVIAYNKNLVPKDKIPRSIVDIANDPFYKGRFDIGDPRIGGATWTVLLTISGIQLDLFNKLAQQSKGVVSIRCCGKSIVRRSIRRGYMGLFRAPKKTK